MEKVNWPVYMVMFVLNFVSGNAKIHEFFSDVYNIHMNNNIIECATHLFSKRFCILFMKIKSRKFFDVVCTQLVFFQLLLLFKKLLQYFRSVLSLQCQSSKTRITK